MEILLLGGTRFIGRHIAAALREVGEVTLLNRGLSGGPDGFRQLVADRSRREDMAVLKGRRFDAIVDISAESAEFVAHTLPFIEGQPHYVYLSSASVYQYGAEKVALALKEGDATGGDPVWGTYGVQKYRGEQLLRESGLPVTILRPPYVYGPYNNCGREDFLWARLINGQPIFVTRDGTARLQFSYVADLAALVAAVVARLNQGKPARGDLAAESRKPRSDDSRMSIPHSLARVAPPNQPQITRAGARVLNVAEARHYSVMEYIEVLAEVAGTNPDIRQVHDEIPARSYFPFRDISFALTTAALFTEFGDARRTDLTTGLAETFRWFNDPSRRDELLAYVPTEGEQALLAR